MAHNFKAGDEVIRKSGRRVIGTVVAYNATKCRVRWHAALRPFSGGYSDNHTTVLASSLVPATDENRQKMQADIDAANAKRAAWDAAQRYCETCRSRYNTGWTYCSRCQPVEWAAERQEKSA